MIIKHTFIYFTLFLSVIFCTVISAKEDSISAFVNMQSEGNDALPVYFDKRNGYIINNEKKGLAWVDTLSDLPVKWQGPKNLKSLDWRAIDLHNQQLVITALDSNTAEIHLIYADIKHNQFQLLTSLPAVSADIEALCLSKSEEGFDLYSINTLGMLEHFNIAIDLDITNVTNITTIRTLNVGPNISDCTVIDNTRSLFLLEEEVGVWHYEAQAEGKDDRRLLSFHSHTEPNEELKAEYESISSDGISTLYLASPDLNHLLVIDTETKQRTKIVLSKGIRLDSINVTAGENQLTIGAYDENLGLFTYKAKHKTPPIQVVTRIESLIPSAETDAVNRYGDAADDPAIWVNSNNPSQSLIFGTDKKYGLNIYDLKGKLKQTLPVGRINNIDIRQGILYQSKEVDIAVASNRTNQSMSIFLINRNNGFTKHLVDIPTDLTDVYGLCLYKSDTLNVLINDTNGQFNYYKLLLDTAPLAAEKIASFNVDSQPEGCVVDDAKHEVFYGEEEFGIWKKDLLKLQSAPELVAEIEAPVSADIEGLGIFQVESRRYLLASSQGNNRFAVYAIDNENKLVGVFDIGVNPLLNIDAVSETDGLEVTHIPLGNRYPNGLLVVQDGRNVMPLEPQNFKLISAQGLYDFIINKSL